MKKAVVSVLLSLVMTTGLLAGCGSAAGTTTGAASTAGAAGSSAAAASEATTASTAAATAAASTAAASTAAAEKTGAGIDASKIKVGVIYIGDENEGYTEAHMTGIDEMQKALGLSDSQVIEKKNIPEDESCYDAAADLADQGCNIIFGTSFGHEDYIIQAAKDYPNIQFCHATGYQAASSKLSNMHNYFTSIYEARYVSGVVAGMKLNDMIQSGKITKDKAKIGYVGAYPYAEVISGFTSFYLGAKSVCPTVTMDVQYTNSWASMDKEAEVASQLIANGCVLISQHADTTGAPSTCEQKGVPCVGYNVDMTSVAPKEALTSAAIDWGKYYTYAVKSMIDGTKIDTDWCKGFESGAVNITPLNTAAVAQGTDAKVKEVEDAIKAGTLHVFDTSTFTVKGSSLEKLISSDAKNYGKYSKYVSGGYYHESEVQSAPSFDIIIDGITSEAK